MTRRHICILVWAAALVVDTSFAAGRKPPRAQSRWRKLMSFNVLDTSHDHRADIGNHRIVIAHVELEPRTGWDIGVFDYPVRRYPNLLYNGRNCHGPQPWHVLAWSKHRGVYPDKRIIAYNKGSSQLKVVLRGSVTKQTGRTNYEFVKGRIEVFHRP